MIACPTEVELERYLGGAIGPEIRRRIREHVTTCGACASWLERATDDERLLDDLLLAREDLPPPGGDASPPRYRIVRQIGAGGMGIVYEAEQASPRRLVALKVMRPTRFSDAARWRFEHEAQILGRLGHPDIARVFEAGTLETPEGPRPFLSMELVRGRPLDEYAREHALGLRARLALLARVARAVHHAHEKGVIHRDLKPANILVTEDGDPKVLDFGVARAVDRDASEQALLTREGQLVGTLPFMSPEQLVGDPMAIDTRTDVYALGVLLYVLACGRLPFDPAGEPVAATIRRISETAPPLLGRIDPSLRGDVETIAAKAMAREPAARYASAAALAEDVERHLRHEPILARPPSTWERVRLAFRRHRTLFFAGALVLASLVTGLAAALVQGSRARSAERETARQRDEAMRQARIAEAVNDFLQEVLMQASPLHQVATPRGMVDVLEEASRRVERYTDMEPAVEAAIRHTLGRVLVDYSRFDDAERHLRAALDLRTGEYGERDLGVAGLWNELARIHAHRGEFAEAEALARRALALRRELGEGPKLVAGSVLMVAQILRATDRPAEAIEAYREVLLLAEQVPPGELPLASVRAGIGSCLGRLGRHDEAAATLSEALAAAGGDDLVRAGVEVHLAAELLETGDLDGAEARAASALDTRRRKLGPEARDVIGPLQILARVHLARGDPDAAEPYLDRAVELERRYRRGTALAGVLAAYGRTWQGAGRPGKAEALFGEALATARDAGGAKSRVAVEVQVALGKLLLDRGDDEGLELLEALPATPGEDPAWRTRIELDALAARCDHLWSRGKRADLAPLLRELVELAKRTPGADDRAAEARARLAKLESRSAGGW